VAWQVEPGKFWSSPTNLEWLAASERLVEAFARYGGRRFVGVGSSAEYAEDAPMPLAEGAPIRPTSLYGTAKARLHEAVERMAGRSAFTMAWARVFLLIGEAEPAGRLAPYVVTQLLRGEPALCSHGNQIRDFMDVRDVGHAIAALALSEVAGPVNIGTGNPVTVSEILSQIGDLTGRRDLLRLGALPPRDHDPPVLLADVARLREEVGFRPAFTLPETLSHVVAWWRANMEPLPHEARI
jgi:nucleoside-diphosphate-sugar epimerase